MSSKNVKVAKPYADAFLEIASKSNVINDLNCIATALSESKDLQKAIANPLVSSTAKKDIIKSIFSGNVDSKTVKFMMVLCDRGRIEYLDAIVETALVLAYKQASIEMAYVTSSVELSSGQTEALVSKLKEMTKAEQIKLDLKVDESLIGGFKVQIGSRIIDTSVQNQLKQLSSYLGASVN
uniref:ATP synthase CF1 delta subunit n=1 Tax=Storeatula sp. CCMP1868 TaxID=195070 RepID=A0A222AHS2_9CRYP|nr:ATP synthase CF1 delta subunit [Storeatula sp. CCMP1868]